MKYINLKRPEHSYFFGFAQADGSLRKQSRNRGYLEFELKKEDEEILEFLENYFLFLLQLRKESGTPILKRIMKVGR